MDPNQFDEFTKSLATKTSRRQALKTFIASTFGGLLALNGLGTVFAKKTCKPACSPGLTCCGGKCVDTKKDPNNCGVCGTACISGLCVNGLCCASGAIQCGDSCCIGTCINGNTCCPTGQACGNGCCPVGQICINGNTCCTAQQVCGNTCCPQGQICQGGMCVKPPCPVGTCTGTPCVSPPCNPSGTCFCYQTTEGSGGCGPNVPCSSPPCKTCGDCPLGSFCAINTCCGPQGICIPACNPGMKSTPVTGRATNHR